MTQEKKNIITNGNINECAKETEKVIRYELAEELNKFSYTLTDILEEIQNVPDKSPKMIEYEKLVADLKKITQDYTCSIEKKFKSYDRKV